MSSVLSRPFEGRADLEQMIGLARVCMAARLPGAAYWHPGDVSWQLYTLEGAGPAEDVRLWFDETGLAGFAIYEPPLRVQFESRPGAGAGSLEREMIAWAVERRQKIGVQGEAAIPLAYRMLGADTLATMVLEQDRQRQEMLEGMGFVQADRADLFYSRRLDDPIPDAPLPAGFRLRHATAADTAERAGLHADAWSVWGPSSMTAERHALLRAAPLYREDLDVVAEAPGGRLVSYCVCWADAETGVATFEPVGTRPSFTGKGLSRAVICEALRRLRGLGMHTALVSTAGVNEAAQHVYPSCGFREIDRGVFYVKPVAAS